jgi:AcrR family transcriptional regulator
MKRLPMRKIRDALRLRANGLSMREIAASLGVGQSTLNDYLKRAARAGLVWPLPEALTDAALEAMLFQPMGGATRRVHAQPDWPTIHRELRRKDVTLALLWRSTARCIPTATATAGSAISIGAGRAGSRRPCASTTSPASGCSSITPAPRWR